MLAHLLHEHQVGFVNRAVKATYDTRTALAAGDAKAVVAKHAALLTRYLLFSDEAKFPKAGIGGDALLKKDFSQRARRTKAGLSLRDFDLRTRIFKYRCSYMIHSAAFAGLPPVLKQRVFIKLRAVLEEPNVDFLDPNFAYLPPPEKYAIAQILTETVKGFAQ